MSIIKGEPFLKVNVSRDDGRLKVINKDILMYDFINTTSHPYGRLERNK